MALVWGNQLTGEIPPELGRLSNLTHLDLADNGLTGEIPPELGGLANLQRLYLGGNLLTGCVPDGLRDVPNNDIARLGLPFCSNQLTGEIPPELGGLSNLTCDRTQPWCFGLSASGIWQPVDGRDSA